MNLSVAMFSAQRYDIDLFTAAGAHTPVTFTFFEARLNLTTCALARGYDAVCVFVNDDLNREVLRELSALGVKHIALRCAGFNNVDTQAAKTLGMLVSRVPAYSPQSVAEHTLALILTLNRKTHHAYNRVRNGNFSLQGLMGFTLYQKTVGVIGTGAIGLAVINILAGFGCRIVCHDPAPAAAAQAQTNARGGCYVSLDELYTQSDIITLHCPLTHANHHLINAGAIEKMRPGITLINTSRGALIDTQAVISALKRRHIKALGLDVYEQESSLFFSDHSLEIIDDDVIERLLSFPNVLITGHQGFFTEEALNQIVATTIDNLGAAEKGETSGPGFVVAG
ncbi:2-hydroxyacid dehydrogenase [Salinimonas marina]|uniref:2-hydroxyacid dehydrogenase n=1 Tax=Salinimonas marina TaxID=2785918 RepID=A0A7S9HBQ9_9ALTE|nr:2-hydroxyacid dehydrogenase [Salinimonas marina]QPG04324.1 2-hydroxyacid dehydrogenase [Salinimonas marina]